LVTGGAGYIGSVCAEALLQLGHDVLVADDLSSGRREAVLPPAKLEVVRRDDPHCWERLLKAFPLDAVMHFAATALIDADPETIYSNNVSNTLLLLSAMRTNGVRNLIFSSTAAVYGEPSFVPITEEHVCAPINAYGDSKLAIERALKWYRSAYGLRAVMFRYFNVAGATERCGERRLEETHIIPLLLDAALGSRSHFEIFGDDYPTADGTCVRDYIHVLDIVNAHIRALDRIEQVDGEVFNIGSGTGFSVKEIHEAASRATGTAIPLRIGRRRTGDPAVLVADAGKLRRVLRWVPKHSALKDILESSWRWRLRLLDREAGTVKLKK
jgi:UDP-glucose 4-epimerase